MCQRQASGPRGVFGERAVLLLAPGLVREPGRVVPPHPSSSDLLFLLQSAELLLSALLALPQLLAVLVHVLAGAQPVFEAAGRKLRRQPGLPGGRQRRGDGGLAEENLALLEAVAWLQSVAGDDVKAVPGQGLAEGALVAGAGEHT